MESGMLEVPFPDEGTSNAPGADKITITNNMGVSDTVAVSGLANNDIVKVYSDEGLTTKLGQKTAIQSILINDCIIGF